MKNLLLIRHAKSSWKENLPDRKRPLSKRGYTDLDLMTRFLKDKNYRPDLIVSSPARRAMDTADTYIKGLGLEDVPFQINEDIYDF